MVYQLMSQLGTIDLFITKALALCVDHDALRPDRRRRDETPSRNVVQCFGGSAHRLTQAQATAVTTCTANGPALFGMGRKLPHQLRVVDETAG